MTPSRIWLLPIALAGIACTLAGQTERVVTVVVTATDAADAQPAEATAPPAPVTTAPVTTELEARTLEFVEQLADDGYLQSTSGTFHAIPEFNETWAQLNWYQWWETGFAPKDFVVTAHTAWESASDTADWWNAGCGFVFREESEDDHYLVYLGMDGWVHLARVKSGDWASLGETSYGEVDVPKGEADIALVVEGREIHYFVNGEHVLSRDDLGESEGVLALTLLSGTNKEFGTRCIMDDIALWEIQ
jgi:hypothetical protein